MSGMNTEYIAFPGTILCFRLIMFQGDSGGPIILPAFRDFLVGIVKDGIYCGGPYPGKCQRVSPFRKWIQSVAGEMNFFCLYS